MSIFLNEQQREHYQQFLRSNPTNDQQIEYFHVNLENLSVRETKF